MMETKERIMQEALNLFAMKGYAGTSIKEIANAVSIKDSSIYKHYKSKKEIFDTIVQCMSKRMEQLSKELHLSDIESKAGMEQLIQMDLEHLIQVTQKAFLFYAKDEFASKFRRMLTIEQYKNSEASDVYRKIFMEDSIAYQTMLFQKLIDVKVIKEVDPSVLAISFYTPIFYCICRYDTDTAKESEVLEMIKNQVTEFYRIYHNDCCL